MGLLIISTAVGIEKYKEFELPIKVRTEDGNVNITINNEETYNYNCNHTDIDVFEYEFGDIVEFDCGTGAIDALNFSTSVDKMASTCNKIIEAHGDASSYYTLYVSCKSNLSTCHTNLENKKGDALAKEESDSKAESCQIEFDKCKEQANTLSASYTECNLNKEQLSTNLSNCEFNLWIYTIIGAVIGAILSWFFFIGRHKMSTKTDTDRVEPR